MLHNRSAFLLCLGVSLLTAICAADVSESKPEVIENQNRTSAGQLEHGTLTLHLELRRGLWHPEAPDGRAIEVFSFAEEGQHPQTPGPLIRVPQGTELRVSVHNLLDTSVFVHGLHQHPGKVDDFIELAPNETKEARFTAGDPGTYLYWASTAKGELRARPREGGLMSGAFIVDAPGASSKDRIFVIQEWEKNLFKPAFDAALSINGKSWPHTERLHAQIGKPEHWRILNASPLLHPMHLHGFYFHVEAVGDGESEHIYSDADKRMAVTELVRIGDTYDMTWMPERSGNWLFHCHVVEHMTNHLSPYLYGPDGPSDSIEQLHHDDPNAMGMGRLVMVISVEGSEPHLVAASAAKSAPATKKDLFVRERKPSPYFPGGPGFYLEGISKEVGLVGPPLVITRGERTAITVHNELTEPTAIHWHGIEIESYYDGVPGLSGTAQDSTPSIPPGGSFVAYVTPPRAGTFIYHTHWHDVKQLTSGMYGALIVLDPGQTYDPSTDKAFVLGRGGPNDIKDPLLLNGNVQPTPMFLLAGKTYRFRFINITTNDRLVTTSLNLDSHPVKWRAIAKDGANLPPQQATVRDAVQDISVGETYDFEFSPQKPGQYELRFCSNLGSGLIQMVAVVPTSSPFSVFAAKQ